MKTKLFLIFLTILCCAYFSYLLAFHTHQSVFPAYYRTAKIVLDPTAPITSVYELDDPVNRYNIPEKFMVYRYSIFVAYLLSPLGLFPYFISKAIFIFTNIILSLLSFAIALHLGGSTEKGRFYLFALPVFFIPFIINCIVNQIDGFLLFLITIAIIMATKNRFYLCGALIGFAALFKFFPMAIAMALGLKNWRIFAGCIITVALSALAPGFREWLVSFTILPFDNVFQSAPYRHLHIILFIIYVIFVSLISAYFIYRNRHLKYEQLTSFTIPVMFLVMPIVEPVHLLLMLFPFGYMFHQIKTQGKRAILLAVMSIVYITFGSIYLNASIYMMYVGLLLALATFITALRPAYTSRS